MGNTTYVTMLLHFLIKSECTTRSSKLCEIKHNGQLY